jgi:methylated-DNA-[protein]-cysteine S-methyltransferase
MSDDVDAADGAGLVEVAWGSVDSPVGELHVAVTEVGVVCVAWAGQDWEPRVADAVSPRILPVARRVDAARRQLEEYFAHRRTAFDLAVDWSLTGGFRRTVLQALAAEVPYGQVASYGELAARVGRPGASRAVGGAVASNPIPIIVPCHRVLRTGGGLGGYSGAGGIDTKRTLLALEGALSVVG